MDRQRYAIGSAGGGGGFSAYAAGNKRYGSGTSAPTVGPVDRSGYIARDAALAARQNAILRRLQSSPNGQYLRPSKVR